jgi:hypothetical protein
VSSRFRHRSSYRQASLRTLVLVALAALLPSTALAVDEPSTTVIPPPGTLPALPLEPYPTDAEECLRGDVRCVDLVIAEMERRLRYEAKYCLHDAAFTVQYLRTTQSYRWWVNDPNFFEDNAFVNHEDAVFAEYYFRSQDAYRRGRLAEVPEAWRVAFDASAARALPASGNVLLGVNAHVNRDLPFVLAEIGIVAPDGRSRKRDHDQVNKIFPRAQPIVTAEIAHRFDPTFDDANLPFTFADDQATIDLIASWREEAWRNAERLVAAPSREARAKVAAAIEEAAALKARTFVALTAYGPFSSPRSRDNHCATFAAKG